MEVIGSLMALAILLIALGMIVNGPRGADWVYRTFVRNPGQTLLRAMGRGIRRALRSLLRQIWEGITEFARHHPRWLIMIILSLALAFEIYLLAN